MLSARWRILFIAVVTVAVGVGLVACGTGDAGNQAFSTAVVDQRVAVSADPSGALRWDKPAYEAVAGDVTFVVSNSSGIIHQFSVEGNGVNYSSPNIKPHTTVNFTIMQLPPGEYQIVCNYPGHKEAGMIARLTVR